MGTEDTYGTLLLPAAAANINFTGGVVFHTENISFPGLTLKHVPRSSRMAPMDIMHTTSYCCSIVILAVSLTISALQSILRQNDLAGRL